MKTTLSARGSVHRVNESLLRYSSALLAALSCLGCEPTLVVGSWSCATAGAGGGTGAADFPSVSDPVPMPWSTGFEDELCSFGDGHGFCYANTAASFEFVASPVHSGDFAMALHIEGDGSSDGLQARCARHGTLPLDAYYGAWFYIPSPVTATDNWNLFHFDGRGTQDHHDTWDVTLDANGDGTLDVYVYDFLRAMARNSSGPATVTSGQWFHLEVHWLRATDDTGSFEVFLDGEVVLSLTDLVTDDSDIGEWYLGSLATLIEPAPNTLFVDDVTMSSQSQFGN